MQTSSNNNIWYLRFESNTQRRLREREGETFASGMSLVGKTGEMDSVHSNNVNTFSVTHLFIYSFLTHRSINQFVGMLFEMSRIYSQYWILFTERLECGQRRDVDPMTKRTQRRIGCSIAQHNTHNAIHKFAPVLRREKYIFFLCVIHESAIFECVNNHHKKN